MPFFPPHRILYEPLNDKLTGDHWKQTVADHGHECDFESVDAAELNSVEDFAPWLTTWMSFTTSSVRIRIRVLIIWHAHFLSPACQQVLRRSLESRSFKCRIWFHIEEPSLQSAIISRCTVTTFPTYMHTPIVHGLLDTSLWEDPLAYEHLLKRTSI
jgi:DNA polymerase III delta prime subunit